ncbi:MAG: hypothetical protein ACPGJV_10990 [Bacteriovoracaceae bacterium]
MKTILGLLVLLISANIQANILPIGQKVHCAFSDEPDGFVIKRLSDHLFQVHSGGAETDYYRITFAKGNQVEMVRTIQGGLDQTSEKVKEDQWLTLIQKPDNSFQLNSKIQKKKSRLARPCKLLKE